jgi:hypothetical protein
MDSRVVARKIKSEIWPLLRRDGFTRFSTKTAWRYTPEQIHVVNFQSFSSYHAEGLKCTTFSFAVNLGIYFRCIPFNYPPPKGCDPSLEPQEYECHFRHVLSKRIGQEVLPRRDIWYVEPDGSNVLETLADARTALEEDGLTWFSRFASLLAVFHLLLKNGDLPELYAAHGSPEWKYTVGHIARTLGRSEVAEPMIAQAEGELEAIRIRYAKTRGKIQN